MSVDRNEFEPAGRVPLNLSVLGTLKDPFGQDVDSLQDPGSSHLIAKNSSTDSLRPMLDASIKRMDGSTEQSVPTEKMPERKTEKELVGAVYDAWNVVPETAKQEQRQCFDQSVEQLVLQHSNDPHVAKRIEIAAGTLGWMLFGEPGDPLPEGLAVLPASYTRAVSQLRVETNPTLLINQSDVPEVYNALETATGRKFISEQARFRLANTEQLRAALKNYLLASPVYDFMKSFDGGLPATHDRPLTLFEKEVAAAAIERAVRDKYAISDDEPLKMRFEAHQSYGRGVQSLDNQEVRGRSDQARDPMERVRAYYHGVMQELVNSYSEDCGNEALFLRSVGDYKPSDDDEIGGQFSLTVTNGAGTELEGDDLVMLEDCVSEWLMDRDPLYKREGISYDLCLYAEWFFMRRSFTERNSGITYDEFLELVVQDIVSANAADIVDRSSVLDRDYGFLGFILRPDSPVILNKSTYRYIPELHFQRMQRIDAGVISKERAIEQANRRMAIVHRTGDALFDTKPRILEVSNGYHEANQPPERAAYWDLTVEYKSYFGRYGLISQAPMIEGYSLVGIDTVFDTYQYVRTPETDGLSADAVLLPLDKQGELADMYEAMGLIAATQDLRHSRISVKGLAQVLKRNSTYTYDEAYRITLGNSRAINPFDHAGELVKGGKLQVQCTGAAAVLAASLRYVFGYGAAQVRSGLVLYPDSDTVLAIGHSDVSFTYEGRLYYVDSTPPGDSIIPGRDYARWAESNQNQTLQFPDANAKRSDVQTDNETAAAKLQAEPPETMAQKTFVEHHKPAVDYIALKASLERQLQAWTGTDNQATLYDHLAKLGPHDPMVRVVDAVGRMDDSWHAWRTIDFEKYRESAQRYGDAAPSDDELRVAFDAAVQKLKDRAPQPLDAVVLSRLHDTLEVLKTATDDDLRIGGARRYSSDKLQVLQSFIQRLLEA